MCMGSPFTSISKSFKKTLSGSSSASATNTQLTSPPPTLTAAVVQPAGRRGSSAKRSSRRGTSQLTVKRPTMGGSYTGSGVNLPA